jgi:hypothetical protein
LRLVQWSRVSADIFYNQSAPDPAEVLATVVEAKDMGEALAAFRRAWSLDDINAAFVAPGPESDHAPGSLSGDLPTARRGGFSRLR